MTDESAADMPEHASRHPEVEGGLARAPEVVQRYVRAVSERVADVFGTELVGVYTTGSLALGDFLPGRSDVDLMGIVHGESDRQACLTLASTLDHRTLPCPAAGLEFVLYPQATVSSPTVDAGYVLNLNTGAELPPVISLEPSSGPSFWFVIDRAVTFQSGQAVRGPAARQIFRPLSRERLLPSVIDAVEAQRAEPGDLRDNVVLNAARALRFAQDGRWYSKLEAARLTAATDEVFAPVVRAAIESYGRGRRAGGGLPADRVRGFLDRVLAELRQAG